MRIKSLHLVKFKRFEDLTINVPESARLVVVSGTNGSGKSGILEALNVARRQSHWGPGRDESYFSKYDNLGNLPGGRQVTVQFHGSEPADRRLALWVRSAYRHEDDFNNTSIGNSTVSADEAGLERLIAGDKLVSVNHARLLSQAMKEMFDAAAGTDVAIIRERLIGTVRDAMRGVFGDLELNGLTDPSVGGTFYFSKGTSKAFPYKNLSAGERAAFDLLLDLAIRSSIYKDTVFAIDEPELHLGSKIQGALLEQLLELLPDTCQLWVATHSTGMMKQALARYESDSTGVAFFDTFNHDFDESDVMEPITPDRRFWRRVLEVALDDLADLVAPGKVILCEGHEAEDGFDAQCYRALFASEFPDAEFISVGNSGEVKQDKQGVAAAIQIISPGTTVTKLIDRDAQNATEVEKLNAAGTRVLSLRNIEGYLFRDEVISALCAVHGKPEMTTELIAYKAEELAKNPARGHAVDDVKKVSKALRARITQKLELAAPGSTVAEFSLANLVPLIQPGTETYRLLKSDVFNV